MIKANAAAGITNLQVRSAPQNESQPQTRAPQSSPLQKQQEHEQQTEIVLEESRVPRNHLMQEEEEELEEEELYEDEEEEEESDEDLCEHPITLSQTHTVTSRKRSCGDLEAENAAAGDAVGIPRTTTPPKRPRTDSVDERARREESVAPKPTPRQRKRSSEELDVSNDSPPSRGDSLQKRLRVEESSLSSHSAPRALSVSPAVVDRTDGYSRKGFVDAGDGDFSCLRTGLVNGGELDGLYVFEEP